MHELSIAQSIYSTVLREMQQRQRTRVRTIGLRIGVWSGIMPEALEFGFESIIPGTPLAEARLQIEEMPLRVRCNDCGTGFTLEGGVELYCPNCSSKDLSLSGGDELEITFIEME